MPVPQFLFSWCLVGLVPTFWNEWKQGCHLSHCYQESHEMGCFPLKSHFLDLGNYMKIEIFNKKEYISSPQAEEENSKKQIRRPLHYYCFQNLMILAHGFNACGC